MIVKFVSEISKKILPTASIFIRAVVVVGRLGTNTVSVPSLGVLAASVSGNVFPPSVESEILTFAQLIGAFAVFATFQVTDRADPLVQETPVLGAVTTNGPELPSTVIATELSLTPKR